MSEHPQPEYLEPPVRADGPIRLADPDPEWAAQYAREEERIRAALGPRAAQVEHVGSTSDQGCGETGDRHRADDHRLIG